MATRPPTQAERLAELEQQLEETQADLINLQNTTVTENELKEHQRKLDAQASVLADLGAKVRAIAAKLGVASPAPTPPAPTPPATPTTPKPPVVAGEPVLTVAPQFCAKLPIASGQIATRVIGTYKDSTPIAGRRYRDGVLIPGATQADYRVTDADVGRKLEYEEQAEHNTSKATKWFRSAAVFPVKGAAAPSAPSVPSAPAAPGSVQAWIDDMRLKNDFVLKGYENRNDGWYIQSDNGMGAHPIIDATSTASWSVFYNHRNYWGKPCHAILGWAAIFEGVNNRASNVTVELADAQTWVKSKSTGKWLRRAGPSSMAGDIYPTPGSGSPSREQQTVSKSGTSSVFRLAESGTFWHGWGDKFDIDPHDVAAVHVRLKARLRDNAEGAEYGVQTGCDYYLDMGQRYTDVGYAPSACIGRTKRLTTEWQDFSCTTLTDVGNQNPGKTGVTTADFKANPPPL